MNDITYHNFTLINIDAWREPDGGWFWNDLHKMEVGIIIAEDSPCLHAARALLARLRQWGFLTERSKGRVRVDWGRDIMDGYCIVVEDRNTGQPLIALSTIH